MECLARTPSIYQPLAHNTREGKCGSKTAERGPGDEECDGKRYGGWEEACAVCGRKERTIDKVSKQAQRCKLEGQQLADCGCKRY